MARKRFEVLYPDGSKRQIGCEKRNTLLASLQIKKIDDSRYVYTGEVRTFHVMSDLGELREQFEQRQIRCFLEGAFIIEAAARDGRKKHERLESVDGMVMRLQNQGVLRASIRQ